MITHGVIDVFGDGTKHSVSVEYLARGGGGVLREYLVVAGDPKRYISTGSLPIPEISRIARELRGDV